MRVSSLIIGMILVSLVIVVVMGLMSELNQDYTPTDTYDSSRLEVYDRFAALNNQTEDISDSVEDIGESTGVLDVIGSYFSSAYQAFKVTLSSFSTFKAVSDAGISELGLGSLGNTFKVAITAIVLVAIFVGVFMTAILKWKV